MSREFAIGLNSVFHKDLRLTSFADRFMGGAHEPIRVKYETVRETMLALLGTNDETDLEFPLLEKMTDAILQSKGIDEGYKEFLAQCRGCLRSLNTGRKPRLDLQEQRRTLRQVVADSLVEEPLLFQRQDFEKARNILRPIQHTYCREALIDIVQLPYVLTAPRRWGLGFWNELETGIDYSILVPKGPVETWGPKSRATTPLGDDCVSKLERPHCRVLVVAPLNGGSVRSSYIWDRVRSTLLDGGVRFVEEAVNSNEKLWDKL
jgi:hypothetical protein